LGRKISKLSSLDIDEVSLVDRGANQHAKVLLHKRLDEGDVGKSNPSPGDVTVDGVLPDEDEDDEFTPEKDKKMSKGFFANLVDKVLGDPVEVADSFGKMKPMQMQPGMQVPGGLAPNGMGMPAPGPQGMMPGMPPMGAPQAFPAGPGQMPGQMQAGPQLPPEVVQYIQQLEQAVADANGDDEPDDSNQEDDVNPFGKSAEDLSQDEVDFLSELAKNLDDEDTREAVNKALEMVEQANHRAEQAEGIAKAERDYRLNQEYVSKAQSYVNLPLDSQEFGPVLKRLHDVMEQADVEVIEKALSAANETLATSGIFTEIGKAGSPGFSMVSKVDVEAQSLMSKSEEPLTKEQAIVKVLEANPSLYEEYLSDTNGRG
jgi:hypothetical protein